MELKYVLGESNNMAEKRASKKSDNIWSDKPWILPSIIIRGIASVIFALLLAWLEVQFKVAAQMVIGIRLDIWTYSIIFIVWFVSASGFLLLRASNFYILRQNSIEIIYGVVSKRSFLIAATGFSELEVVRSVTDRLLNMGQIVVISDSGRKVKLRNIRSPIEVSNMIREAMTKPVVRLEHEEASNKS